MDKIGEKQITFGTEYLFINGAKHKYGTDERNIPQADKDILILRPLNCLDGFNLFSKLEKVMADVTIHGKCPVNKSFIEKIVDEKIKAQPGIVWTKSKKIFWAVIGGIIVLATFINSIKQLFQ